MTQIAARHELASSLKRSDFEFLAEVGQGFYSKVYMVRKKDTGLIYSMKMMTKTLILDQGVQDKILLERSILERTNYPYILKLRFSFQSPHYLYLISDFANGGDLWELWSAADRLLAEEHARFYAAELYLAIHHLHNHNILHRDLKFENVLIDRDGHVLLADFGLSKKLLRTAKTSTVVGTYRMMSPEMLDIDETHSNQHSHRFSKRPYTRAVDWWSYGIMVAEMLYGVHPFIPRKVEKEYCEWQRAQQKAQEVLSQRKGSDELGNVDEVVAPEIPDDCTTTRNISDIDAYGESDDDGDGRYEDLFPLPSDSAATSSDDENDPDEDERVVEPGREVRRVSSAPTPGVVETTSDQDELRKLERLRKDMVVLSQAPPDVTSYIRNSPILLEDQHLEMASEQAKDFVEGLLKKNPSERLGTDSEYDIQYHAFFKGIDWSRMERRGVEPPLIPHLPDGDTDLSQFPRSKKRDFEVPQEDSWVSVDSSEIQELNHPFKEYDPSDDTQSSLAPFDGRRSGGGLTLTSNLPRRKKKRMRLQQSIPRSPRSPRSPIQRAIGRRKKRTLIQDALEGSARSPKRQDGRRRKKRNLPRFRPGFAMAENFGDRQDLVQFVKPRRNGRRAAQRRRDRS